MYRYVKRFFAIVLSGFAILVLCPLLIPVMIILKCTGEHDIFYRQDRIGYKNRHFKILKFATMLRNSPNMAGGLHTTHGDPRVLPFGRFLRKTKINELPQIFNVIKGDMSLVGPRPYLPREREDIGEDIDTITMSLPGITGYWQVSGRNDVSFQERVTMDTWYVRNWSVWLDIWIIIKTVYVVLRGKGAY